MQRRAAYQQRQPLAQRLVVVSAQRDVPQFAPPARRLAVQVQVRSLSIANPSDAPLPDAGEGAYRVRKRSFRLMLKLRFSTDVCHF